MNAPTQRDRDFDHLHPTFRSKLSVLADKLASEGMPFRIFEGLRSPQRQQYLFDQGRTRPGNIVTNARPWTSNHQYGLAADLVLFENGSWSWDTSGPKKGWWNRLHELARAQGLEPLSWELPHIQLQGLDTAKLREGNYPPGGDRSWADCLEAHIYSWSGSPPAPPVPDFIPERPALETVPLEPFAAGETVPEGAAGWHRYFAGREWRYDRKGVYVRDLGSSTKPLRTPGEPTTCRAVWAHFNAEMIAASRRYGVPLALIMMVIATETGFARKFGFSGPHTFRWESHVKVEDVSPPIWGDYSAGPMQTLATTARWVIRTLGLDYDPFTVAPVFEFRPEPPPALPLYEAAIDLDLGTAEIKRRLTKTGDDPILVAAAYNAGGLYKSSQNPWHLRSTGDHLDRAARWYGDACAVLKEVQA
ncbi:MAG: D-alanyl-D-alanine carboxypeptidase family protein [Desulfobacterales bacterium]|nr:MAG: D-alanyl-D-alanine carboxypeptidase family protein [Desulfobacterales bacterium]